MQTNGGSVAQATPAARMSPTPAIIVNPLMVIRLSPTVVRRVTMQLLPRVTPPRIFARTSRRVQWPRRGTSSGTTLPHRPCQAEARTAGGTVVPRPSTSSSETVQYFS